jgi:hypothetical protein
VKDEIANFRDGEGSSEESLDKGVFKEIHDAVEEMEMVSIIRGCRLHSQTNTLRKLFPMMPAMEVK